MAYEELVEFIDEEMQMSHIYQPAMLMTLLSKGGKCHERENGPPRIAIAQRPGANFTH
jgi:hypothetical protein